MGSQVCVRAAGKTMESCPKKGDCGVRADMKCRSSTLQRCSAVPPGGPGGDVGRRLNTGVWASGSGAQGAFPWAPALMEVHPWDPRCHSVSEPRPLTCGEDVCFAICSPSPGDGALPHSTGKKTKGSAEETEEGGSRTWEVPKSGLSISSTPLSFFPIFQIQSPVKGEGEGKTEGLMGADKAQSTLFGSLQGLAGERGTTGPSVSVGLCRWATSRVVGSDTGPGYREEEVGSVPGGLT